MPELKLGDLSITYLAKTSDRCKNATLKIRRDLTVEVVIPSGEKINVEDFLKKESKWIQRKYDELSRSKKTIEPNRILYRGKYYPIERESESGRLGDVEFTGNKLIVHINEGADPQSLIHNWMKSETSSYVRGKVDELSKRFDV